MVVGSEVAERQGAKASRVCECSGHDDSFTEYGWDDAHECGRPACEDYSFDVGGVVCCQGVADDGAVAVACVDDFAELPVVQRRGQGPGTDLDDGLVDGFSFGGVLFGQPMLGEQKRGNT